MATALSIPQLRLSDGARRLNLNLAQRGVLAGADFVYYLKDVFTTIEGRWDPDSHPYSLPQWARDSYLRPYGAADWFDDAGGNHHLFARVEDETGKPINELIRFWTQDGQHIEAKATGDKASGWANIPIWSSFVPERGERGDWLFAPNRVPYHIVEGGGLPGNQHVSLFAVWQRVALGAQPPVDPGAEPSIIDVTVTQPGAVVRVRTAVDFKLEVIHGN